MVPEYCMMVFIGTLSTFFNRRMSGHSTEVSGSRSVEQTVCGKLGHPRVVYFWDLVF